MRTKDPGQGKWSPIECFPTISLTLISICTEKSKPSWSEVLREKPYQFGLWLSF